MEGEVDVKLGHAGGGRSTGSGHDAVRVGV